MIFVESDTYYKAPDNAPPAIQPLNFHLTYYPFATILVMVSDNGYYLLFLLKLPAACGKLCGGKNLRLERKDDFMDTRKNFGFRHKAGVILPVSSLPGKYGIGTFGPEAYDFVDFLEKAGQTMKKESR